MRRECTRRHREYGGDPNDENISAASEARILSRLSIAQRGSDHQNVGKAVGRVRHYGWYHARTVRSAPKPPRPPAAAGRCP